MQPILRFPVAKLDPFLYSHHTATVWPFIAAGIIGVGGTDSQSLRKNTGRKNGVRSRAVDATDVGSKCRPGKRVAFA